MTHAESAFHIHYICDRWSLQRAGWITQGKAHGMQAGKHGEGKHYSSHVGMGWEKCFYCDVNNSFSGFYFEILSFACYFFKLKEERQTQQFLIKQKHILVLIFCSMINEKVKKQHVLCLDYLL